MHTLLSMFLWVSIFHFANAQNQDSTNQDNNYLVQRPSQISYDNFTTTSPLVKEKE